MIGTQSTNQEPVFIEATCLTRRLHLRPPLEVQGERGGAAPGPAEPAHQGPGHQRAEAPAARHRRPGEAAGQPGPGRGGGGGWGGEPTRPPGGPPHHREPAGAAAAEGGGGEEVPGAAGQSETGE